jgi:hypothetical protein
VKKKIISACRPYYDQIYNCNLEISPTPAIIKINCQNCSANAANVVKGGALGLILTDSHEKITFLNDAF